MLTETEKTQALAKYATLSEEFAATRISLQEKEIAAVGISVAAGCRPCTDYHLKAAAESGANEAEISGAVDLGLRIRGGAVDSMAAFCRSRRVAVNSQLDAPPPSLGDLSRSDALLAVGAAVAVNCVATLDAAMSAAEAAGIPAAQVRAISKLAVFIRKMAASHVEKIAGVAANEAVGAAVNAPCGC